MADHGEPRSTATHWGVFRLETRNGELSGVEPWPGDPEPSPIGRSLLDSRDAGVRIAAPAIRRGFLEGTSGGEARGAESFVEVSWMEAVEITAKALQETLDSHGPRAVFGGSYGWASAGRFHHAQSQLHRFLNHGGGYVGSRNTYSFAAAEVIIPHVFGEEFRRLLAEAPPWDEIAKHADLFVAFGGLPPKNMQVNNGGVGAHTASEQMSRAARGGVRFIGVSPLRDDIATELAAEWIAVRPNTDVALMLGLAHTLVAEDLCDQAFLDRYCHGFPSFAAYVRGETDGQPKDASWAADISGVPADTIRGLARRMATMKTLINVSWSLQRAEHGEQPYWMATTLASMIGQIGLPGRGIAFGIGAIHGPSTLGRRIPSFPIAALPQGKNPVEDFIPVARIADMLLDPGGRCDYDGKTLIYPEIRLVYWVGGNPFHHHQDLNRLRRAWARPQTVIVHEAYWTATARRADIVLPATTSLERNDFAAAGLDHHIVPMPHVVAPFGRARSDFDIFSALAARLGFGARFTAGRSEMQWVEHLYEETRAAAATQGVTLPAFAEFFAGGPIDVSPQIAPRRFQLERFREDPEGAPLRTPSGKIQLFSEVIEGFAYEDCRGHAAWYPKREALCAKGAGPEDLHLISNQPRLRLHSQLDHGRASRAAKVAGREPARLHPADAAARGIGSGDIIRIFNARGACLAGAVLSDDVMPGVVELATGAWYDTAGSEAPFALDVHGNPNALTRDIGASALSQGPAAHSCLVRIEVFASPPPAVGVFSPPPLNA